LIWWLCKGFKVKSTVTLDRTKWYGSLVSILVIWCIALVSEPRGDVVAIERMSWMVVGALIAVSGAPYILKDD
jgi:hypothetical protein